MKTAKYDVTFYCPDRHLAYDVRTLDQRGVGGGITSRVRLAHALAGLGHRVVVYGNPPAEATIGGVRYRHFGRLHTIKTDVFIAGTSGDALDLSPLGGVSVEASLRMLMAHGANAPAGMDCQPFNFIQVSSNFMRDAVVGRWGIPPAKVFVCHQGVVEAFYRRRWGSGPRRDPFALAYASHPTKGLEAARAVLRILREEDPRFSLHVFGGNGLWGRADRPPAPEPGVEYHGLAGQRRLARDLMACGFSLNLQSVEDTFGKVIIEAMRAGCVVLASPVGAFRELITHGRDGFLMPGPDGDPATHRQVAEWIRYLNRNPEYGDHIRRNACAAPMDWSDVARTWQGFWHWAWGQMDEENEWTTIAPEALGHCDRCGGQWLTLADGHHCLTCGRYGRGLVQ